MHRSFRPPSVRKLSHLAPLAALVLLGSAPAAPQAISSSVLATEPDVTSLGLATGEVLIGHVLRFEVIADVPAGGLTGVTLTDALDAGMAFITLSTPGGDSIAADAGLQASNGTFDQIFAAHLISPTTGPPAARGRTLTLDFGDITNSSGGSATITLSYRAVVLNDSAVSRGLVLSRTVTLDHSGGSVSATTSATIVEPSLQIAKEAAPATVDPNQDGLVTLTVSHSPLSDAPAFETVLSDPLPAGMTVAGPLSTGTCNATPTTLEGAAGTITATWERIDPGNSCEILVPVSIVASAPGTLLPNTGDLSWESLPIDPGVESTHNSFACERTAPPGVCGQNNDNTYAARATATVQVRQLDATKADALLQDNDGDSAADPGDHLRYTVVITNLDTINAAGGVVFTDTPDPGTALLVGSVTTTQGTVTLGNTTGNTSVAVSVGNLPASGIATITFDVDVLDSFDSSVSNQGLATTTLDVTGEPTDDPDTPADDDATITAIQPNLPALTASKRDDHHIDLDADGIVEPGDTLRYTVVVANVGGADDTSVVFSDGPDANTALVVGSVIAGQGTVDLGNTTGNTSVSVDIGTLSPGAPVVITFDVMVLDGGQTSVANQGLVTSADNPTGEPTDDPDTPAANDATVTPTPRADLSLAKTDDIDPAEPGSTLTYTLTVTNLGPSASSATAIVDSLPQGLTFRSSPTGCSLLTGTVTCPVPSLSTGESRVYTFTADVEVSAAPILSNTASVTGFEHDPDPANNQATETTVTDTIAPRVTAIDTLPATGTGTLGPCDEVTFRIASFRLSFDEAMDDPAGDAGAGDVTSTANYLLVGAGSNDDLETDACAAVGGDDQIVTLASVSYDASTNIASLFPARTPTSDLYRLFACGSPPLRDLAGNPLDGDGDGTGGDDFAVTFRIELDNALDNGNLDCNLDGWTTVSTLPAEIEHDLEDADTSDESGSAHVTNLSASADFAAGQCVPSEPNAEHEIRASLRLAATSGVTFSAVCDFHDAASCGGSVIGSQVQQLSLTDSGGLWTTFRTKLPSPLAAASALCSFAFHASGGAAFDAWLDEAFVSPPALFRDGFESGDTSAWNGTVGAN